MNVTFEQAVSSEQFETICEIAKQAWHSTYDTLLPEGQTDYMIETFQSLKAVTDQTSNQGYLYYLIRYDSEAAGYFAIVPNQRMQGELFLSKIYLLKHYQGRGLAAETFRYLRKLAAQLQQDAIYLTVNKGNETAVGVYRHTGFHIEQSTLTDIGGGYAMDDYIMKLVL